MPSPPVSLARLSRCVIRGLACVTVSLMFTAGQPAGAAPAAQAPDHAMLSGSAGVGGIGVYQPQHWGIVQAQVVNPTDHDVQPRVIFRFDDGSQRQFVVQTWLPPKARRQVRLPVRFGAISDADITEDGVASSSNTDRGAHHPPQMHDPREHKTASTETLLTPADREVELAREQGLVRLMNEPAMTAIISDNDTPDDEAITTITLGRKRLGLSPSMAYVADHRTMRYDVGWDGVRLAVLTADKPDFDPAQRRAIQRWIAGGGTLLVFADQVDPQAMRLLMGDAWSVQVVDHVTLTNLKYTLGADAASTLSDMLISHWQDPTVVTEQPIEMTRLLAPGFETLLQVRGWPALIQRPIGRGKLVVATIGGRGWSDKAADSALEALDNAMLGTTMTFGTFNKPDAVPTIAAQPGQQFVSSMIGYRVISRQIIAAALGAMLLVIIIAALELRRRRRMEWLAPISTITAVAVMGVLIGLGRQQRGQVPSTLASVQQVDASTLLPEARLTGLIGLYDSGGQTVALSGDRGGWTWPDPLSQLGQMTRMQWLDLDDWRWPSLPIAAGAVRPVQFASHVRFDVPPQMHLQYGPDGLTGTIRMPGKLTLSDPLIAAPQANIAVDVRDDADMQHVSAATILPHDVYSSGGLIDQTTQSRSALLGSRLTDEPVESPCLVGWTDPLTWGMSVDPKMKPEGQALWFIPLHVEPTPAGQHVRVPWPLIPMHYVPTHDEHYGLSILPIYRPDKKRWLKEISGPSAFVARFVLPKQVLPIKLTSATIHIDISAIGRPVRLLAIRDKKPVVLATLNGPDGQFAQTVPVDQMQVQPDGSILLAFDVQNPPGFSADRIQSSDIWHVNQFGVEVSGVVGGESESPSPKPAAASSSPEP